MLKRLSEPQRNTWALRRPDMNNPLSLSSRFRRRRFRLIEGILREIFAERRTEADIIDVGGRRDYWRLLDPAMAARIRVTIVNLPGEIERERHAEDDRFTYVAGDGCALDYGNRSFDLAHSNSTIEHVGSLSAMVRFAREIVRVAPRYYVQTPYLWFPVDPHVGVPFAHWLPNPTRARLRALAPGFGDGKTYAEALEWVDNTQMIDARLMREIFPTGTLRRERLFGLTKSLIMSKALLP